MSAREAMARMYMQGILNGLWAMPEMVGSYREIIAELEAGGDRSDIDEPKRIMDLYDAGVKTIPDDYFIKNPL